MANDRRTREQRVGRTSKGRAGAGRSTSSPDSGSVRSTAAGKPKTAITSKGRARTGASGKPGGRTSPMHPMGGETDYSGATGIRGLFNPLWCYHGFIVAVVSLTVFGLIMVFSSSTVSLVSQGLSPWSQLTSQGMYAVLGLAAAVFFWRRRVLFYRRIGFILMLGAIFLQLLTLTPLGRGADETGNSGWIYLGVFSMQPAEVAKLALCIWLPSALQTSAKRYPTERFKAYAMPAVVYAISLGLVLLGKDLGTALILVFIGVVAFMISGFPIKAFFAMAGVLVVLVLALVIVSPNRLNRVLAAYQTCSASDLQGVCYQSMHSKYAMASGGLLGVGLGNSREKWNYLPEAHNDFIFAVIGEETGFIGAALVILLFVVIGWCLICVALQCEDRYVSMMMICITVWIVGQALVNIGVVVGIFPVLGVPMPFVSAGGSSLIMCLSAAGVAASLMRSQPQIKAETRLS